MHVTIPRRAAAAAGVAALAAAGAIALAAPAQAHTHAVDLTCSKATLTLASYAGHGNHAKVTVAGDVVLDKSFDASLSGKWAVDPGDVVRVVVAAVDDPKGKQGWSFTYRGEAPPCTPCPPAPTVTVTQAAPPPVTVTAPPVTQTLPAVTETVTTPGETVTAPPVTETLPAPPAVTVTEPAPPAVTVTGPPVTTTASAVPVVVTHSSTVTEPGTNRTVTIERTVSTDGATLAERRTASSTPSSLPRTGGLYLAGGLVGLACLLAGGILVIAARRRGQHS